MKNPRKLPIWYRKWSNMIRRCYSPKTHNYKDYGGRGITVCDRWRQRKYGPDNFLSDMGVPPPGMTLGRKDNNLGYSPENCRWETWKEQAQNRRPVGPAPDPNSIRQKALKAGLPYLVVYHRIKIAGWSEEKALTTPKARRSSPLKKATSPLDKATSPQSDPNKLDKEHNTPLHTTPVHPHATPAQ